MIYKQRTRKPPGTVINSALHIRNRGPQSTRRRSLSTRVLTAHISADREAGGGSCLSTQLSGCAAVPRGRRRAYGCFMPEAECGDVADFEFLVVAVLQARDSGKTYVCILRSWAASGKHH